jgi:hypothetical protein
MNHNVKRVADAVDSIIPDPPNKPGNIRQLKMHKESVMVGCCREIPVIAPSFPEIGMAIGCSHSYAMECLRRWEQMPWRDRYAWLVLVEGRLNAANTLDAALL